jgi:hypothetical protein
MFKLINMYVMNTLTSKNKESNYSNRQRDRLKKKKLNNIVECQ